MNIYAIFLYDVVYLPCENILFTVYLFKLLGAIIWSSRRNFTMWYYGGNYLAMENFLMLTIIAWNDSFKEYAKFQVQAVCPSRFKSATQYKLDRADPV